MSTSIPLSLAVLLLAHPTAVGAQTPLGTAFTYQGRLSEGGSPVNGAYDFQFALYDAAAGGGAVGLPVTRDDVAVTDGLFVVSLDFGASFGGSKRWLEIGVRPGASTGAYTTVGARQELTPSPFALFSASTPWFGLLGVPPGFADGIDDVGTGWGLTGNAGTDPATSFVGTTDAQPLVLRTNNTVALRLLPEGSTPAIVGGYSANAVSPGALGATIAGGGQGGLPNRVTDAFGTVGGGQGNQAGDGSGTVFDAGSATVAGGVGNTAGADDASVGGGNGNAARGRGATVPGGFSNVAGGDGSFAGGFRATVQDAAATGDADGDEGSFVWADYAPPFSAFTTTGPNQFLIRAGGGVGINTNAPAVPLDVDGVIRSRQGGFRFPDGTTQTTAAVSSGGDITAVNTPAGGGLQGGVASGAANLSLLGCGDTQILKRNGSTWDCALDANSGGTVTSVTAGSGLTGGTITTAGTLGVAFAGSGAAATAARSDHNHDAAYAGTSHTHLGQTWVGATTPGLKFLVSGVAAMGLWSESSGTGGGRGVFGWSTAASGLNYGVFGQTESTAGVGVQGVASTATGSSFGVVGRAASSSGVGVKGEVTAGTGTNTGVWGESDSTSGRGVFGIATAASGVTIGVFGEASSTTGTGVFGDAGALTGPAYGVTGRTLSNTGVGVFAIAESTSGSTHGVFARSSSTSGRGVAGEASAASGTTIGVEGITFSPSGTGSGAGPPARARARGCGARRPRAAPAWASTGWPPPAR